MGRREYYSKGKNKNVSSQPQGTNLNGQTSQGEVHWGEVMLGVIFANDGASFNQEHLNLEV